jgi:hypothetical protein
MRSMPSCGVCSRRSRRVEHGLGTRRDSRSWIGLRGSRRPRCGRMNHRCRSWFDNGASRVARVGARQAAPAARGNISGSSEAEEIHGRRVGGVIGDLVHQLRPGRTHAGDGCNAQSAPQVSLVRQLTHGPGSNPRP